MAAMLSINGHQQLQLRCLGTQAGSPFGALSWAARERLAGPVIAKDGATIAPGNSIGTLTFATNLSLEAAAPICLK